MYILLPLTLDANKMMLLLKLSSFHAKEIIRKIILRALTPLGKSWAESLAELKHSSHREHWHCKSSSIHWRTLLNVTLDTRHFTHKQVISCLCPHLFCRELLKAHEGRQQRQKRFPLMNNHFFSWIKWLNWMSMGETLLIAKDAKLSVCKIKSC